ncbi:MAG: EF-Tu/IF-2/RF-3 family GTPase [Candidatus Bathyarchaeota archaeon]
MNNLTIAVLGKNGYSNSLAKKGTSSDITLYNFKKGETTLTFIEPTRYPDRLAPLFYACSMSKMAIIVVEELNQNLGESLVMLQTCGITEGFFILQNYISPDKIKSLIKDTILENYQIIPDDPIKLRELVLNELPKFTQILTTDLDQSYGTVPVDHAFNVKGIGTVILGVVTKGIIKVHSLLKVLPGIKTTQIRSIQKHDDNFDYSSQGDRVGLALKNIKVEDIDRGTVLTNDPIVKNSNQIKAEASIIKYWNTPLKEGMILHLGHWMQFLNSKIESIADDGNWRKPTLTLSLEKEIIYNPGDKAVLTYLDSGKLRIIGTIELP